MPFWDRNRWMGLPAAEKPVTPFSDDQEHLEAANYLLSIGDEIYVSDEENKRTIQKLKDNEGFTIDPGQFAFLLTEETVSIPLNTIGFISIRASIKFHGLVNVSGFHVDPGYHGKLIFAVFNAGPTKIHLKRSDRIFMLWIADLTGEIAARNNTSSYSDIPASLVNKVSGNFTTAYQVQKQVDGVKKEITELNAFKLYAMAILGLVALLLFPTLKDNFFRIIQTQPHNTVSTSDIDE
jgi:dCTP deaminase